MFAMLADTKAAERSSTRKRFVSWVAVHPRPETDEGGGDELCVLGGPEQELRDVARKCDADDETERRHAHDEPEGSAEDATPSGGFGRIEVEAEEGAPDPHALRAMPTTVVSAISVSTFP